MDRDAVDSDDVVASLTLSLASLQRRPKMYHHPSWFHFYGAPPITEQWPALPGSR